MNILGFFKKSIQRKFLLTMFLALLAVNGPLLVIFFIVSSDSIKREMQAKNEAILTTHSAALSKPLWDFDFANLEQWVNTIALEPHVAVVEILDDKNKQVARASEAAGGHRHGPSDLRTEEREIQHIVGDKKVRVGTLRITYHIDQIDLAVWQEVGKSAILFVVSTIAVLVTAVFGNRQMIVRPLSRLTSTIDATRIDGRRRKVLWQSADELGQVAYNFNEMQDRLDVDEDRLKSAHKRLTFLYNNTPVMLYSVDDSDRICGVSEYWLHATGYSKDEVTGTKFADLLTEDSQKDYADRPLLADLEAGEVSETTCAFRKKMGGVIDVMIRETPDCEDGVTARHSLSVMTDISSLKAAEAAMRKLAQTDALTGLLNRDGFNQAVFADVEEARTCDGRVSVLFFDLDRFKWVNDNLGHSAGDFVLRTVTERVQPLLYDDDKFSRFGGDEFALLISGEDLDERAVGLASEVNRVLSEPFELDGRRLSISASIGISFYPDNAESPDDLLRTSDVAMYRRKREGRNGYCVFNSSLGREAGRYLEIEQYISDGLANDWFELYFQPIYDLSTNRIAGFEGLLRLNHPELGMIAPDEIIKTAEQNGTILEIGGRVLDLGVEQLRRLSQDPDLKDAYVALNLSAAQFLPGLPAKLAGKLMRGGVDPKKLVLEITESVLMHQAPGIKGLFDAIHELGCRFALDDFGTGYSSLSYMNRFPVDIVKIDRSFVLALGTDDDDVAAHKTLTLIEGILLLSHQLGLHVVAEGIETEAQLKRLQGMGVDAGQGYFIGRPQPYDVYLDKQDRELVADKKINRLTGTK